MLPPTSEDTASVQQLFVTDTNANSTIQALDAANELLNQAEAQLRNINSMAPVDLTCDESQLATNFCLDNQELLLMTDDLSGAISLGNVDKTGLGLIEVKPNADTMCVNFQNSALDTSVLADVGDLSNTIITTSTS